MQKILMTSLIFTGALFANNVMVNTSGQYVEVNDNKVTIENTNTINSIDLENLDSSNVIIDENNIKIGDSIKIDSETGSIVIKNMNIDMDDDDNEKDVDMDDPNFPFND